MDNKVIFGEIENLIDQFVADSGKRPLVVYLGREQVAMLMDRISYPPNESFKGKTIYGLQFYPVSLDDHIAVY